MWRGHEADKLPIIMGHECSGIVERAGSSTKGLSKGDRVAIDYRITCGNCYYCSSGRSNLCDFARDIGANVNGGYAEYMSVPYRQLYHLPAEIGFEEGAIIGCAVATAYHAARRVAEVKAADDVAIIGVGGVGYHILKFVKAMAAKRIIAVDLDDRKLARAARLGAETINPGYQAADKLIRERTNGEGVEVAFEAIGNPRTVEATIRSVSRGGRAIQVGICSDKISIVPWDDLMYDPRIRNSRKEMQLRISTDHLRTDIMEIIEMVSQKRLDLSDSVTHRVSLDEVNRGIEMMDKKIGDPVRIVIQP
jgi:propanol-preferring alcohol dehydrogenase